MTVLLIEPGKKPRKAEIEPVLEVMQEVVGGYIQAVYPFEDLIALICSEEGKLLGLPLNRVLRDEEGDIFDVVAGTFFLCGISEWGESFESLTEDQCMRYEKLFRWPEQFLNVDGRLICLIEKRNF